MSAVLDSALHPGAHAGIDPDRPAIVMAATGETVGYAELEAQSARLARAWRAAGLQPGDGVALLVENHPRFLVAAWAAQRSGLYFTPISTQPAERLSVKSFHASACSATERNLFAT